MIKTQKSSIQTLGKSLAVVFKKPSYIVLALVIALLLLLIAIWLPNIPFISHTIGSKTYSLDVKLGLLFASLGFFETNFTPLIRTLTIIVAMLTGINVAMVVFYLKWRVALEKAAGTGIFGTIVGLLGVGCASCGSVVLSSIFGLSATATVIGVLPLKGAEFGILGILILLVAIYIVAKKIHNPLVCKIHD